MLFALKGALISNIIIFTIYTVACGYEKVYFKEEKKRTKEKNSKQGEKRDDNVKYRSY